MEPSSSSDGAHPGRRIRPAFLALCTLFGMPLAAQATWIVDVLGRGNFADLPAAVQAASPGDLLLVRTGNYTAPALTRGLAIHGSPGTRITRGRMTVGGIPRGEHVALVDLAIVDGLDLATCEGTVHLDGCVIDDPTVFNYQQADASLSIASCRLVSLRSSRVESRVFRRNAVSVVSSALVIADSHLIGSVASYSSSYGQAVGAPGLFATSATISIMRSSITGGGDGYDVVCGWWIYYRDGPSALVSMGSTVHLGGAASASVVQTRSGIARDISTCGGELVRDPRAIGSVENYYYCTPGPDTVAPLDDLELRQVAHGLEFRVTSAPGATSYLLLSRPSDAFAVPGLGIAWLDTSVLLGVASVQHAGASASTLVPLDLSAVQGLAIAAQALVLRSGSLSISEPAMLVVRDV